MASTYPINLNTYSKRSQKLDKDYEIVELSNTYSLAILYLYISLSLFLLTVLMTPMMNKLNLDKEDGLLEIIKTAIVRNQEEIHLGEFFIQTADLYPAMI
jgi:hypothetical protein